MAERTRLIIHAGIHRTGTTAVQTALAENRLSLAGAGFLYPIDFVLQRQHGADGYSTNHEHLAWALDKEEVEPTAVVDWLREASKECHTVILSGEDFCAIKDLYFLPALAEYFEIELLIYLRRQDDWINSWYNQHIKWPFDERLAAATPIEFLGFIDEFHWLKYFDLLERWAKTLGREHVHARIFEPAADTTADVLSFCGIDAHDKAGIRLNQSLPADTLELIRRIGIVRFAPSVRAKIIEAAEQVGSLHDSNVYPRAIRRLILQKFANQNRLVAERYFGRSAGQLFADESFPQDPPPLGRSVPLEETLVLAFLDKLIGHSGHEEVRARS